jgi:hypothetical protein
MDHDPDTGLAHQWGVLVVCDLLNPCCDIRAAGRLHSENFIRADGDDVYEPEQVLRDRHARDSPFDNSSNVTLRTEVFQGAGGWGHFAFT